MSIEYTLSQRSNLSSSDIELIHKFLQNLSDASLNNASVLKPFVISHIVDGRGLACPMPLLKLKVALRSVADGESVYVLATDPNSKTDIDAFCRQSSTNQSMPDYQLDLAVSTSMPTCKENNEQTDELSVKTGGQSESHLQKHSKKQDTIFHLIITKSHGKMGQVPLK